MIITRTPFRVSFFGGGTDFPAYYKEHGGAVLSTTIDKYCNITCRTLPPFFDYNYYVRYSRTEHTSCIDDIQHPSVRECLRACDLSKGLEVVHSGDIPAMSGIGSSSSFTVGLLHALNAMNGGISSKRQLAEEAIHVEQNMIKENVGSQDQVAAAFGGLNLIEFGGSKDFSVKPITLNDEKLEYIQSCLMFYYTGISRISSNIAEDQIKRVGQNGDTLKRMRAMTYEAQDILNGPTRDLDNFGRLMDESWQHKRSLSNKISTSSVDSVYKAACAAGALGGKLCGAGGGGFLMLFVPQKAQQKVSAVMDGLLQVPVRFDHLGSHIIYYSRGDTFGSDVTNCQGLTVVGGSSQ